MPSFFPYKKNRVHCEAELANYELERSWKEKEAFKNVRNQLCDIAQEINLGEMCTLYWKVIIISYNKLLFIQCVFIPKTKVIMAIIILPTSHIDK